MAGKWLGWVFGPLPGMITGFSSYRFFKALDTNPTKAMKMITKKRSLFKLEQVDTGLGPLHVVSMNNNLDYLQAILNRTDAKYHINDNSNLAKWTPSHCAASKGHVEVLKMLMSAGANASLRTNEGTTTLHIAAGNGYRDIVEELLKNGVHVDEYDTKHKWTALHFSAYKNSVEIARYLLSKGADPSLLDEHNMTPLYVAVSAGSFDVFQVLIPYKTGYTKVPAKFKLVHLASQLQSVDILKALHELGFSLSEYDNEVTFIIGR